jgi:polysaccharide export outer membrane protein
MERRARWMVVVGMSVVLAAGGCAKSHNARLSEFAVGEKTWQPSEPPGDYRVLPPDVISISSVHVPEINGVSQQIRPDGKVSLPLVGEVVVAGKTPTEIAAMLEERTKEYYEQTDAVVSVTRYASQQIYVFGQVSNPGPQPWSGTNTLVDVLSKSQPTQLAWPQKIKVVRGASPTRGGYLDAKELPEGEMLPLKTDEPTTMTVDMMAMVQSGDLSQNVLLRPDDVVYVPPNPLAAVGLAIQQVLFPIRPAMETLALPASTATTVQGVP